MSRLGRGALAAVGLTLGGVALAGGALPRLPADRALPQGEGSPGQVTFSHASHVDAQRPACVGCHPARFRILAAAGSGPREALRHDRMEAGAACGACHGKTAFDFTSCELCHR